MFIYKKLSTTCSPTAVVHTDHSSSSRQDTISTTASENSYNGRPLKRNAESAFERDGNPPLKDFLEHLNEVRLRHRAVAVLLEKGIKNIDHEGNKLTAAKVTQAQIDKLRFSIITQRRSDNLYKMRQLLLQDQFHNFYPLMEYLFSTHVVTVVPMQIEEAVAKSLPEQFDHLYAITKALMENEYWLLDYEDKKAIQKVLTTLGKSWKKILAHTDEELEIDGEFTRPGCIAMLNRLSKTIQGAPDALTFKWEL